MKIIVRAISVAEKYDGTKFVDDPENRMVTIRATASSSDTAITVSRSEAESLVLGGVYSLVFEKAGE